MSGMAPLSALHHAGGENGFGGSSGTTPVGAAAGWGWGWGGVWGCGAGGAVTIERTMRDFHTVMILRL